MIQSRGSGEGGGPSLGVVLLWRPRPLAERGGGSQRDSAETEPPRTGIPADPGGSLGGICRDKGLRRLGPWENCASAIQILVAGARQGASDLLEAAATGGQPSPGSQPGAPLPCLRALACRLPQRGADHEGRSPWGGASPHSALPCSPLIPGRSLGSPRDPLKPPFPPWTCLGTPALLAGRVCAVSP